MTMKRLEKPINSRDMNINRQDSDLPQRDQAASPRRISKPTMWVPLWQDHPYDTPDLMYIISVAWIADAKDVMFECCIESERDGQLFTGRAAWSSMGDIISSSTT